MDEPARLQVGRKSVDDEIRWDYVDDALDEVENREEGEGTECETAWHAVEELQEVVVDWCHDRDSHHDRDDP